MTNALEPHEAEAISNIIDSHWATFKKPIALANVGHQLSARGEDVKAILKGRKMGELIKQAFDDKYAIRERPGVLLTWEVYPKGKEEDPAKNKATDADTKPKTIIPRMPSPVWHAFTKEISSNRRREVTLSPFRFMDRKEQDSIDEANLLIEGQYVIPRGSLTAGQHASEVWASIQRWSESQGLEIMRILERQNHSKAESVLNLMIKSLSQDQLSRVQLPLDVVAALRDSNA